jgi:hypothetical protein
LAEVSAMKRLQRGQTNWKRDGFADMETRPFWNL